MTSPVLSMRISAPQSLPGCSMQQLITRHAFWVLLVAAFHATLVTAQCPDGTSTTQWTIIPGCQGQGITLPRIADTCEGISSQFGITTTQLQELNPGICCSDDASIKLALGAFFCYDGPDPPVPSPSPELPSSPQPEPLESSTPPEAPPSIPPDTPATPLPPSTPPPVTPASPEVPDSNVASPPPDTSEPVDFSPPPQAPEESSSPSPPVDDPQTPTGPGAQPNPSDQSPSPSPSSTNFPVPPNLANVSESAVAASGGGLRSTLIPAIIIPILVVIIAAAAIIYYQRRKRHSQNDHDDTDYDNDSSDQMGRPAKPFIYQASSSSHGSPDRSPGNTAAQLAIDIRKLNLDKLTKHHQAMAPPDSETSRSYIVDLGPNFSPSKQQDMDVSVSVTPAHVTPRELMPVPEDTHFSASSDALATVGPHVAHDVGAAGDAGSAKAATEVPPVDLSRIDLRKWTADLGPSR